jgi:hypothetical protein
MTRSRQPPKGIKMNRIVATAAASILATVIGTAAFAVELPYTGNGDPLGLTSSNKQAAPIAVALQVEVPYTGNGDPLGLISGPGIDLNFAVGSVGQRRGTQVPYTGFGDPDDLI